MSFEMAMPRPHTHPTSWRRGAVIRAVLLTAGAAARLTPDRLQRLMVLCSRGAVPAGHVAATAAHHEVVVTSPRCAGWRGCLPRSIAVALLCRLDGQWPTWCIGIRTTLPFAAHAWVQAEDRMVGEPGSPADYRPLIRVPGPHQPPGGGRASPPDVSVEVTSNARGRDAR